MEDQGWSWILLGFLDSALYSLYFFYTFPFSSQESIKTRLISIVSKPINVVVVVVVNVVVVFAKKDRSKFFLIQCPKSVGSKKVRFKKFWFKNIFSKKLSFQKI